MSLEWSTAIRDDAPSGFVRPGRLGPTVATIKARNVAARIDIRIERIVPRIPQPQG
jgi:hypothetical protein